MKQTAFPADRSAYRPHIYSRQQKITDPEKSTVELYNIATDPGETDNLAREYPEIVDELTGLMESARTNSEVFTFK